MRLRLCVQRNGLPPANVVWSVPDTNSPQAYTIARLLEEVNQIIPIEAADWGFEDYIVEVGGYECLHFAPVFQALKDDDLVSIRPLLTAEVRGRTLSGRYQISGAGQHLVDGIPFGRPYLRDPNRPSVTIPSRKRKRSLEDDTTPGNDLARSSGLIAFGIEKFARGDANVALMNGSMDHTAAENDIHRRTQKRPGTKMVRFEQLSEKLIDVTEHDDSDEEDDEDFEPEGSGESDISMGNASDDDSDAADESSEVSDTSSEDSDTDSSSDVSSVSDSGSSVSEEPIGRQPVTPFKGKPETKSRNKRRKLSHKLKTLKALEILPPYARLKDLDEWKGQNGSTKEQQLAQAESRLQGSKRKSPHDDSRTERIVSESDAQNLEIAKQRLLSKYSEASPDVGASETPSAHPKEPEVPALAQEPLRKRMRPNVSAITRIIGHQARPLKKAASKADTAPAPEEVPVDPDYWKSKVNVSAFECWFEDVELSAPPFPFQQHWDPASKEMRERDKAKQKKKRKNGSGPTPALSAPQDEPAELDYDNDTGELEPLSDNIDHDAAVDAQLIQEVTDAAKADLPPLPESVDMLPALAREDLKEGTIVAFKVMEFAPGTMMPAISNFKTAIIEKVDESGDVGLRLAERDIHRKEKKYDAKGNRIYDAADAFQMEDSDDEEGDKLEWKEFGDLLEAKLLQPATPA